jgi:hypothetical protein
MLTSTAPRWLALDQAERDAITLGHNFVTGEWAWPSDWDETTERDGFTYRIQRNSQGYSIWYATHHIGQVKRFGKD